MFCAFKKEKEDEGRRRAETTLTVCLNFVSFSMNSCYGVMDFSFVFHSLALSQTNSIFLSALLDRKKSKTIQIDKFRSIPIYIYLGLNIFHGL